ncbi:cache domain-containing sensor histidine kinase [Lacticaseibacillus camelliae]|uniref:Histidine kinase/HSP90-like ATPase domain-containing protein n=1 Tax=Lacticaseibacillus camelliae DSM 22697 = JCM 13995 TaxID=1423730 RepID=A0A0R2F1R1_9LACO|nr:histidine kinase [Lacticaseibacillus camelliae]KRN18397.1 hypothetical protein FC75_GL000611 [Lacticaseibacillus camelliae DSM 22697 = JCM 13995]
MFKRISKLSLQNKMHALIYALVIVEAMLLLLMGIVYVRMLTSETYARNRVQLSALSTDLQNEFAEVDNLVTRFHEDAGAQVHLERAENDKLSAYQRELARLDLSKDIGSIAATSRVNSWTIMDDRGHRMVGGNGLDNYIKGYSTKDYLRTVGNDSKKAKWIFGPDNKAVYVHNLFDTHDLSMKHIGTVVFTIDLSFIQQFMSDSGLFSRQDFIVIKRDNQYYLTKPNLAHSVKSGLRYHGPNQQRLTSINGIGYYLFSKALNLDNTSFTVHYYIVNEQIIRKIVTASFILLLVILLILIISSNIANYLLRRLILPIDNLARNMQDFKTADDLPRLRERAEKANTFHRSDEIGTLYRCFQRLMSEIDRLVVKDYQSQLLTQEMENKYLMAQIDPHFLYNTLNSINWIALSHGDEEASEVVTSLALLLREKADAKTQSTTLEQELNIVKAYVKIQSVRFRDRLRFSLMIPETMATQNVIVPKLIIQPIVENAVKYGVETTDRPVVVRVCLRIENAHLIITVFNDGKGFNPAAFQSESTGVGLHNISSRLKLKFGSEAGLHVESAVDSTTSVKIWLPYAKKGEVSLG